MPRLFSVEQLGKDRVDGFYETPLMTVEYICSKVVDFYQPGMKVIDPCVGDGIFLYALESAGVRKEDLYGYDIDEEKINKLLKLNNFTLPKKPIAIIMGNEINGVSQNIIDMCDEVLEIPQFGTKHCLNISVATGIIIWELWKKINS